MHSKENKDNNVNVVWYTQDGMLTDEEVIEQYIEGIPGMTMALKGKQKLNTLIWDYLEQENIGAIRRARIKEGLTWEDADEEARKEAARLKEESIMYYETCKEYNETANESGENYIY